MRYLRVVFLLVALTFTAACGVDQELYDTALLEASQLRGQLEAANQHAMDADAAHRLETDKLSGTIAGLAEDRATLQDQVDAQDVEIERLNAASAKLSGDLALLTTEHSALTTVHEALEHTHQTITVELEEAEEEIASEQRKYQALDGQLTALLLEHQGAVAENAELAAELQVVSSDLVETSSSYEALLSEVTSFEALKAKTEGLATDAATLEEQSTSLKAEISALEAKRKPLIVDSYRVGFRCTGSMEPKITCMDEATWLDNYLPQDITVGTVISFTPVPGCTITRSPIAHRVTEIKLEGDIYYFWPKGDNNDEDDGCWIPSDNIDSYIIELHKNVKPEYAALRSAVNTASATLKQAEATMLQTKADYLAKLALYQDKRIEYCGSITAPCTLSTPRFNEIQSLQTSGDQAYSVYSIAYSAYSLAFDQFQTVYAIALR